MKRSIYISLLSVIIFATAIGCSSDRMFDDYEPNIDATPSESLVEVLEDGSLRVAASISATEQVPLETRAINATSPDNIVYTGWCMVFGVDETLYDVAAGTDGTQIVTDKSTGKEVDDGYGPNSPLLQKTKIVANTNGRFYMTFKQTTDRVFLRIISNLSSREDDSYSEAIAKADIAENDMTTKPATFGQFIEQSIGLDAIYNFGYEGVANVDYDNSTGIGTGEVSYNPMNTVSPDPSMLQRAFPMSSYGYVLKHGISSESVKELFEAEIRMIRVFSKIVVVAKESSGFIIDSVTLLKGANESRVRSTVLLSSSDKVGKSLNGVPENLGGVVQYKPVGAVSDTESMPIYLYPNKGGNYANADGSLNTDVNRTYIIIRGKAAGFDDFGYYKVALKARYPLTYDENGEPTSYSNLTYDILRDTYFSVNLEKIDKPGYATFEEAKNDENPANNISYSIVINGEDNRNEFLVSKGTYFVELETSRFYAKGYAGKPVSGTIDLSLNPTTDNVHPNVYIYGEDGVVIDSVVDAGDNVFTEESELNSIMTTFIPASDSRQELSINFSTATTGRIAIRIGDILKYIPVVYQSEAVAVAGETLSINGGAGNSWNRFAYSDIYADPSSTLTLDNDGTIARNTKYETLSLGAKIYPEDGSGFTQLYVKQASDFALLNVEGEAEDIEVVYNSKGEPVGYEGSAAIPVKNVAFNYVIKGDKDDVTFNFTDRLSVENADRQFYDFGQKDPIAIGETIPVMIKDIGTNDGKPTLQSHMLFNLANTAGETKEYELKITQYAAPSADSDFDVDNDGANDYITPTPTADGVKYLNAYIDEKWNWGGWGYKYPITGAGTTLETVEIYNCYYMKSPTGIIKDDEGNEWGWYWEALPETMATKINKKFSAEEQRARVAAVFFVDHDCTHKESYDSVYGDYGTQTFPIKLHDYGPSGYAKQTYGPIGAYFVLLLRNKVGEKCEKRLLIQCEAKN